MKPDYLGFPPNLTGKSKQFSDSPPEQKTGSVPKRAAVYCRVSTKLDTQDGSFETQICHFTQSIAREGLVLVDVYGDHGKSGRYMEGRPEFQRMLADCEAGKIDLILTKSISRFARNLLECVAAIRHLTALGVAVRFEKEGFQTDSMYSELLLSILAAMAQEESASLGQNRRLADEHRNRLGTPAFRPSYGYRKQGLSWQVCASEAIRVRLAFCLACRGRDYRTIRQALQSVEDGEGTGKVWEQGPVRYLLTNVSYMGDLLTNKCYRADLPGRNPCRKNRGNVDQYYIENHHTPMVSRAVFCAVQQLIARHLLVTGRKNCSPEERQLLEQARILADTEFPSEA